ncbi:hypothetical protein BJ508DRAFT_159182 [Ascobolus immersus RN42]|uniref:Uncharacterized protein n=1 Tax=Ascobolus immersus RN42 TaxID=1160509 RepID=A0A3N4IP67_ASCIM|nr:hypothetical protein BJ508DRAFT_159182 [Ascobolus immersus RN42]
MSICYGRIQSYPTLVPSVMIPMILYNLATHNRNPHHRAKKTANMNYPNQHHPVPQASHPYKTSTTIPIHTRAQQQLTSFTSFTSFTSLQIYSHTSNSKLPTSNFQTMKRKSRSRSTSPSKRRKSAKDHHLALPRRILKRKLEANNAERAAKRIRTESPTRVVNETLPAISVRAPEPETSEARFFRALEEKDIGTLGWIFETISETENDLCRGVMEGHISAYINGLIEAGIAAEDDGEDFLKDEVEVIVTWIEEYPFIVDFYQNFRHDGLSLLCAASKAGLVRIVEAVLLLKKKLVADAITVRAAEVTHVEPDLNEDVHMADADNEERAAVVDIEAREGEFERTALGIAIEAMMELYRKDNSASIFKLKRLEETIWQLVKAGAEPAVFEYSLNAARLHILM